MMAGGMLNDLFSVADMIFVGILGPTAIAAVAVAGTALSIFHVLASGLTIGCASLVALALGKKDRQRAEQVTGQSVLLGIGISALIAVTGFPLATPFLEALGAAPEVVEVGRTYFVVSAGGAFAMLTGFVLGSALRGAGDAVTPLKAIAAANLINLLLDPLLIFGWLGFPRLGVAGSAWASVIARGLASLYLVWTVFVRGHPAIHLHLKQLVPDMRTIASVLRVGVFGSGQVALLILSGLAMTRFVAAFGTLSLAALGIGMRIRMVVMMPGFGLGNAAAALVGQNVGAGKVQRAIHAAWLCTGVYLAATCCVSGIAFLWAEKICLVFTRDAQALAECVNLLHWFSLSFILLAPAIMLGRSMNGAGDTFWPMLITACGILLFRIPLAHHFSQTWGIVAGVWAGWVLSDFVQCMLSILVFRWGRWQVIGQRKSQKG